ncbi:MAG: divalent-cation tolerance protein CutA [Desulfobulbus sp.]|nr:MAG: divalent-cation tolerance protein CutA [Desulfobulbus sp.]
MNDKSDCIEVTTTVETQKEADTLARLILEERLAACVQIIFCTSHYHWQEKIEHAAECKLVIKTISSLFPQLERFILKNHPYQVPEILAVAVVNCNEAYYAWLKAEVKGYEGQ